MPSYMTLNKILWLNAEDITAFAYEKEDSGLWVMEPDNDNPCILDYTLNLDQNTFFGKGSKFVLDGMQMKTKLE